MTTTVACNMTLSSSFRWTYKAGRAVRCWVQQKQSHVSRYRVPQTLLSLSSRTYLPPVAARYFLRGRVLFFCRSSPIYVSFRRALFAATGLSLQVKIHLQGDEVNLELCFVIIGKSTHHQQKTSSSPVCHLSLLVASDGANFRCSTPTTSTILNR